jgi:hypothetical protein
VDNDLYKRMFNRLSGVDFEEVPVDIETFVTSPEFLNLEGLSEYQYQLVRAMTQIYKKETLISLYGEEKANERWKQTYKEIIMQLGKGSGKDFSSTVAVSYVCYLLLCLKDPSKYYKSDTIDIINIATNADQANRVFFMNLLKRIKSCPWFDGKYEDKAGHIHFHGGDPERTKGVNVYSGHSEREAFEGYNTLMVILDEISGFAEAPDDDEESDEDDLKKTSKGIYKMYRASVTSRFLLGKLVLLSFPRHEGDFIQKKYNEAVVEKEVVIRTHTFKRDPDLPDGFEGNELTIEWEEDHIIRYKDTRTFCLRRPSWEVNPNKEIDDYADDFFDDLGDALGRYACMPSNVTRGFFKNMDKAEVSFSRFNGVDGDGIFRHDFTPKEDVRYFMHVDLAQKHDKCAVALAHVEKWVQYKIPASEMIEYLPLVVVDAIRWWTPTKEKSVDFKGVIEYVKAVRRRGFDIKLVTFDRWNSHDTMMDLERNGIDTDILSVAKKHYDDWLITMYDGRLFGPKEDVLLKEMRELIEKKGKVDHPRKGNKDLCDAVCGAIFNAVAHTPKEENLEADALTLDDVKKMVNDEELEVKKKRWDREGVIEAPRASITEAPKDIQDLYDELMRVL